MKQPMDVLVSSETNEWYTPPEYVEAVREALGGIAFDPASNFLANAIVQAAAYYTADANGLELWWLADTVFLNPPYGKTGNKSNQEIWARKMLLEFALGSFDRGIMLTKTVPGYKWWDWLFNDVRPTVCITRDRIPFIKPEWIQTDGSIVYPKGQPKKSKAASSFWYIGNDDRKFIEVFSKFGRVIQG
jgi:site-specific DNA-methyltransferase (adenine-specific)